MHMIRNLALILVQNMLLCRFLGITDLTVNIRNRRSIIPSALLTVVFSTLCCGLIGICGLFLPMQNAAVWHPLLCAVICGLLDIFGLLVCILISSRFAKSVVPAIHTAAFSGAVLGLSLVSTDAVYHVAGAFRFGFHSGIGFLIAALMIRPVLPVLCSKKMPECVRGWRGTVLYVGILSMAIACFSRDLQI